MYCGPPQTPFEQIGAWSLPILGYIIPWGLLQGISWIASGFALDFKGLRNHSPMPVEALVEDRRVWVVAKGLLIRVRLEDGSTIFIPTLEVLNEVTGGNEEISRAFRMWGAGRNGPLNSIADHPVVHAFLESWKVDRVREAFRLTLSVPPAQKCFWLTPDCKTAYSVATCKRRETI